jgi:hypothetical protein
MPDALRPLEVDPDSTYEKPWTEMRTATIEREK